MGVFIFYARLDIRSIVAFDVIFVACFVVIAVVVFAIYYCYLFALVSQVYVENSLSSFCHFKTVVLKKFMSIQ